MILVEDIAHALAHMCRFGGHVKEFYSVAQHSVLVSRVVPTMEALMHDAPEAYLGDVTRPLKALLPDYQFIESRVERVVLSAFGVALPMSAEVKMADNVLLATERRDLMPFCAEPWECLKGVEPLPDEIVPWSPEDAKRAFIARFRELSPG